MQSMRLVWLKIGDELKRCTVYGKYADQFDGLNAALGSARYLGEPQEHIRRALHDLAIKCAESGEYRVTE